MEKKIFVHLYNASELINKAKRRFLRENKNATSVSNERVTLEAVREYVKNER